MKATDNGVGGLIRAGTTTSIDSGAINYAARTLVFKPDGIKTTVPKPQFSKVAVGTAPEAYAYPFTRVNQNFRYQFTGYDITEYPTYWDDSPVLVKWRTTASSQAATEVFTAGEVQFDLTPGFGENILQGSARFKVGALTYVDRAGSLYHSINPSNGAGTLAGEIQYASGLVKLTEWQPGAPNSLELQGLVTETNVTPVDEVVFRIPIVPVRAGSFQLRCVPLNGGAQVQVTANAQGNILSPNMTGAIDYQSGVVRIKFGQKVTVTPAVQAQPWFNAFAIFSESSVDKVVEPKPVYADSIKYNAVGFSYLPLSADILGLDPVRLPSDGRVPIFRVGDVAVVHNTQDATVSGSPVAGLTFSVGRVRCAYIKLRDSFGVEVPAAQYNTDLDAGTVTLKPAFTLTGLTLPIIAEHRIEDMAVVTDVQINGRLALNRPLTHAFPANESVVSSALIFGDLQGRVFGPYSQAAWTSEWKDSIIGGPIIAQYNDVTYPIVTTNKGSLEQRWAFIFTSNTGFRCVGETVGQIGTGDTNTDFEPINPGTGAPYFKVKALGWGGAWSAGNVFRFNTGAANYPIWLARTVLQGPSSALNDSFKLQVRGDIDR
jgi:hypothetical protein